MNVLDTLSDYCGIVNSFVDARGDTQTASKETLEALLAAMGITVCDEAGARQALADLTARQTESCLPPVHVHYQSAGPFEIEINSHAATPSSNWRIELEDGNVRRGSLQGSAAGGWVLRVEGELPCGYHTIILEALEARCSLIVTPGQCWLPDGIGSGRKIWGVAAQLYLLRSQANWGIGDFTDLKHLMQALADRGADVVGLNPLHAMFTDDPEQASPYSPASRLLLNVLYIDVAAVAGSMNCETVRSRLGSAAFRDALAHCRDAARVDYSGVAALKLPVLEMLFDCCDRGSGEWLAFVAFRKAAGGDFERSCLFLALRNHFATDSPATADWHRWPEDYRRADSPATRQFTQAHAEAVTFQAWLQFIADKQLQECKEAGASMAVGLYRDLAVGAALAGSETWANPAAVIDSIHVGAPPDIYNPQGQDWGLPAFDPRALRAEGYRSFIELLRANMRHSGGLRIDHVMALQQLFWIPRDRPPSQGAYVRYPLDDLIGILALESQRHRCLVVGEDLGTVPEGFRERMERAGVLSYRVLFFEKVENEYIAPEKYPRLALAVAGSHDLPTLRAWWQGMDLNLKKELHLYPTESHAVRAANERNADREALEHLLSERGLVGSGSTTMDVEAFVEAAHAFLTETRSAITLLQLDDLTGETQPVNIPTTSDEYPNWRRRLSLSLENLVEDERFISAIERLVAQRGGAEVTESDA